MQYKPHDYQQYAINYILEHPIAAVILGMGLGKTSITLTAIEQLMYDSFEINKVLVVAPLRVARNTWSANGKPVMVAYWFKHDLARIMRRLSERKLPFEKLDSEESIRKWNRGELPVALIHPASAGHGLNLQAGGNMLIWFGLTWSLELYQQTVARLWRQGQSAEIVVVQHIITAGTIDEDVMKALANKDMTQNRLIAAVKARVTHGR